MDAGFDAGVDATREDAGLDAGGPPPTAVTTLGPVTGTRGNGYQEFLGIPYAAPPVGDLRFRPPMPHSPWTEPREATTAGARCIQRAFGLDLAGSEDCLFINVHTPDPRPVAAPVLVWIHGGAYVFGEGVQTDGGTRGDILAATYGVVVVSMNYRLGPFGFLAHPSLTAEAGASGNYGIHDQVAALGWVQENISAFGGDRGNVTLFGESAGGHSTCVHLTSPGSRDLFHRAIVQSGLCDNDMATLSEAEALSDELVDAVGCGDAPDIAACLRAVPADAIRDADTASAELFTGLRRAPTWYPNVDGTLVPGTFRAQVEAGDVADVPVIVGWNADEGTLFVMLAEQGGTTVTPAVYDETVTRIAAFYGVAEADVRAQYPIDAYPDPGAALADIIGDATLACPSRRAAELLAARTSLLPVRVYHFTYPEAAFQLPTTRDLGAFHSADIQYVFGHPSRIGERMFSGVDLALNRAMAAYWTRFAATGDPNGEGAPVWPAFDATSDMHLVLDQTITAGSGADRDDCLLWQR